MKPTTYLKLNESQIPVYNRKVLILGSGAAGMACAAYLWSFLKQQGIEYPQNDIVVLTRGRRLGASRMSGSDKQTYYKLGTSPCVSDSAFDFAKTLTAFGACHGDLALIEGVCSLRAFYNLVELGVPFPHDSYGVFVGYKTDHDPAQRATSAGPKTSRFMAEFLENRVRSLGVPLVDYQEVVDFIRLPEEINGHKIVGVLTLDRKETHTRRTPVLKLFLASNLVLAAGGPGELYQLSVYPRGQFGLHGKALLAGLRAVNLTESQYGLASIKFRWNVSGTYMQVIPRIFSTAIDGRSDERDFLCDYFPDMPTMAGSIFLKGYQWPFDAQRIEHYQSSLIDMAVYEETVLRGRRVFLDFRHNPQPNHGFAPFSLRDLPLEAFNYLQQTGALQDTPIQRLAWMNPLAIDLYKEHCIHLDKEPLEIAVCAQHLNGGFVVNHWWESNIPHVFVIGEMAGTHGVKRPGGSALNSGQVGALRAAEYIAYCYSEETPDFENWLDCSYPQVQKWMDKIQFFLTRTERGMNPSNVLRDIQSRMTRYGAQIRDKGKISLGVQEAVRVIEQFESEGWKIDHIKELSLAINTESLLYCHLAMLVAIEDYIQRGGGSRGSFIVLDQEGIELPKELQSLRIQSPCWRQENVELRKYVQELIYDPSLDKRFKIGHIPVRPIPEVFSVFEVVWADFRNKRIFK